MGCEAPRTCAVARHHRPSTRAGGHMARALARLWGTDEEGSSGGEDRAAAGLRSPHVATDLRQDADGVTVTVAADGQPPPTACTAPCASTPALASAATRTSSPSCSPRSG